MRFRAKIVLVSIAFGAILAALAWRNERTPVQAGSSAASTVDAARSAPDMDESLVLAGVEAHLQRSSVAPTPQSPERVLASRELFPGVVEGHVVVAGRPAGSAAGSFVRCTPTIGSPVDGFVDEHDRFEARGLPGGKVEIHCRLEGHTDAKASVFLDDTNTRASVDLMLHELRSLRVWIVDERGSTLSFDDSNANVYLRMEVELSMKWVDRGETLRDRSSLRSTVSARSSRQLTNLIHPAEERTRAEEADSPWCTIDFIPFEPAFVCLVLEGVVVECAALPRSSTDLHLRCDPSAVAGRFHELDIEVLEEPSSAPAANVRVWVGQYGMTNEPLWVTTDSSGRAQLKYLSPVSYHLTVQEGDYLPASQRVNLGGGSRTERVRLIVKRGMRIEGRVESTAVARDVDPREWRISCKAVSGVDGRRGQWFRSASTREGRFEFSGLEPGVFELELFALSHGTETLKLKVDVTDRSVRDIVFREP